MKKEREASASTDLCTCVLSTDFCPPTLAHAPPKKAEI